MQHLIFDDFRHGHKSHAIALRFRMNETSFAFANVDLASSASMRGCHDEYINTAQATNPTSRSQSLIA